MLTKPPRSSFFERNMDMMAVCVCVRVVDIRILEPSACLSSLSTLVTAAVMERLSGGEFRPIYKFPIRKLRHASTSSLLLLLSQIHSHKI
jgi:hypothetical protein